MKFWLVISWRHGWANSGFDMRAFSDEYGAHAAARTHNAVVVEVFQNENDFKTYVDAHDYELRNDKDEPIPVNWVDAPAHIEVPLKWVAAVSPVVRVGQDIKRKAYMEMHDEKS